MWPLISVYAQSTIKKTVEPLVAESLREYKINNFAFDKLRLGSIVSTIIYLPIRLVICVVCCKYWHFTEGALLKIYSFV